MPPTAPACTVYSVGDVNGSTSTPTTGQRGVFVITGLDPQEYEMRISDCTRRPAAVEDRVVAGRHQPGRSRPGRPQHRRACRRVQPSGHPDR